MFFNLNLYKTWFCLPQAVLIVSPVVGLSWGEGTHVHATIHVDPCRFVTPVSRPHPVAGTRTHVRQKGLKHLTIIELNFEYETYGKPEAQKLAV